MGGPIRKNKIFFFGDYQGVRQKTGSSVQTTVPTALAHTTCTSGGNCDLSDYLNPALQGGPTFQVFDPTTDPASPAGRVPFANNIIPAGDVSAPAAKLISEMPMPNSGNGNITNNYVASGSGIFDTNQFDVRGDMQTTAEVSLFRTLYPVQFQLIRSSIFWSGGRRRIWCRRICGHRYSR